MYSQYRYAKNNHWTVCSLRTLKISRNRVNVLQFSCWSSRHWMYNVDMKNLNKEIRFLTIGIIIHKITKKTIVLKNSVLVSKYRFYKCHSKNTKNKWTLLQIKYWWPDGWFPVRFLQSSTKYLKPCIRPSKCLPLIRSISRYLHICVLGCAGAR